MGEQQKKTLAEEVVELLKMDELTVTTAESCTGGLVAARLVDVPGASGTNRRMQGISSGGPASLF